MSHVLEFTEYNRIVNFDSALAVLENEYHAIQQPKAKDKFYRYSAYAWSNRERGKQDVALMYADSMLQVLSTENDVNDEYVLAFRTKGIILRSMKYYDHALRDLNAAMIFAEHSKNNCVRGQLYHAMATVYFAKGNFEPATRYYKRSIDELGYCDSTKFNPFIYLTNSSLNALGLCYERLQQYDSAEIYYRSSLAFIDQNITRFSEEYAQKWGRIAKAVTQGNLGYVVALLGRPEEGKQELREAIKANGHYANLKEDVYLTRIKLTQLCADLGEMKPASQLLHLLDSTSSEINSVTAQTRLWNLKYHFFLLQKDSVQAFEAFRNYVRIKDSVDQAGLFQLPFDLTESYAFIAQRQELMKLTSKEKDNKLLLLVLSILIVLLGLILFLIRKNLKESKRHVSSLDKLNREIFKQHDDLDNAMKSLESSNEENKRLMKVLAHDLRSPVGAMISLTTVIEEAGPLNEEQKECLAMIGKLGNDSVTFMEDLLIVRDRVDIQSKTRLDLFELLEYCATFMRFKAEEKNQRIEVSGQHINALVNRDQIWRVVNNILNNAVKFSPNGSKISVALEKLDGEVEICIKDEGIGIPVSIRNKVFDMFSEAGRNGTGGEKTFGLGLPISKQIIDSHGGRIWFESQEGKGTHFFIRLPI